MEVIRARAMGMCFGVRDALELVRRLENPDRATIHGELVHNERIIDDLAARGFRQTPEKGRRELPLTPAVVITAHGVSDRERQRLLDAGKELIDTTCPLVRRVHLAAKELERQGYFVVVIGRPGHVEVEGIIGDLGQCLVVPEEGAVRRYDAAKIGIVCQTTTPPADARRIAAAVVRANEGKEVRFIDTVCQPTRDRQEALEELLDRVEALVVVGGRHSNNTRQLVSLAGAHGIPAAHVQTAADLDRDWVARFRIIGLTAGTSTPEEVIEAVYQSLVRLSGIGEPAA
jgi:4-hydroxy-3-methylbut-2-enyl diphosphate reductase